MRSVWTQPKTVFAVHYLRLALLFLLSATLSGAAFSQQAPSAAGAQPTQSTSVLKFNADLTPARSLQRQLNADPATCGIR
jgi:hypothetical protein